MTEPSSVGSLSSPQQPAPANEEAQPNSEAFRAAAAARPATPPRPTASSPAQAGLSHSHAAARGGGRTGSARSSASSQRGSAAPSGLRTHQSRVDGDDREEGGQGNSGGQQSGRHRQQRRHDPEEAAFGQSGIALRAVGERIRPYTLSEATAPRSVETTTAGGASTSRAPLNEADVEAAIRQNATALTADLVNQHKNATAREPSPLAFLADIVKKNITPSAQAEIAEVLDGAKGNASRTLARSEINTLVRNKESLKGVINEANLGPAHKSLDRWSVLPDWRKPTAQGLAEMAEPAAIKELGDQIKQNPSVVGTLNDANVWINDAVEKLLPGVMQQLIYPAAHAAAKGAAGLGEELYRADDHTDYPAAIGRLTDADNYASSKQETLNTLRSLDETVIFKALEDVHGKDIMSKAVADIQLTATDAARDLYKSRDLQRAMQQAARSANPTEILRSAVSPIVERYKAVVESKQGETAPATRPESEWKRDLKETQGVLANYAEIIAASAVTNYTRDRTDVAAPRQPIEWYVAQAEQNLLRDIDLPLIAQRIDNAVNEPQIADRAAGPSTAQPPEARPGDDDRNVRTAGKIALNAFGKNAKQFWEFHAEASEPAQRRLLKEVNQSIKDDTETATAAAVAAVRRQPEVRRIILETAPGSDLPDGNIQLQRDNIQRKIVQTVNELTPFPNFPGPTSGSEVGLGRKWEQFVETLSISPASMDSAISTVAKPLMGKATYSREYFEREMLPLLPPEVQQALKPALEGRPDRATVMLGHISFGLTKILSDIHAHPEGYDRRKGDYFRHLLDVADGNGRILFQSIPQYCGGAGHYSNAVPAPATMRNSTALDDRVVEDWLKLYESGDYVRAARADLSITGFNFSANPQLWKLAVLDPVGYVYTLLFSPNPPYQAYTNPRGYVESLLRDDRVDFAACGEFTAIKEQVTVTLGDGWRWNVESELFLDFLGLANETGLLELLHNDWGDHTLSAMGRPAPAKQNYEHFDKLISIFRQPQYRYVQIIFCHTGIGRFVRPNDPLTTRSHRIETWTWNKETGHGKVTATITRDVTAPEHIHKIYELFEAVPNARVDISWNEVTQALMDLLMDPNPAVAKSIFQLCEDHADRILFGSDTVKPVDGPQYHQSLMTGAPLFAGLVQRDIEAAGGVKHLTENNSTTFKILRGNYDVALDLAYARIQKWKVSKGVDPARMNERKANLDGPRAELHKASWQAFLTWAGRIHRTRVDETSSRLVDWSAGSPDFKDHPEGLYPMFYRALPESTHLDLDAGGATGVGTSGGFNNDSATRKIGVEASTVGLLTGTAGALYALTRAWGPPGEGGAIADRVNDAAFLTRAVLGLVRILYTEKLRLQWEEMFEKANVTREGLDQYVSRLFNGSSGLDITMGQRVTIAAATEQFWANYQHLSTKPLNYDKGYTQDQRVLDIQAKVGAYQGAMSRALNLQDSTVDATDARRLEGQAFRALLLTTHGINIAVGLQWLLQGSHERFKLSVNTPEAAFHVLFLLGNIMMGVRAARSLAGGIFKVTDTDAGRLPHAMELAGTASLAAGGLAWSVQDGIAAVTKFIGKDAPAGALDTITAILKLAFAGYMARNSMSEFNRVFARPMWGPRDQAIPLLMVNGALGLAMLISLGTGGIGARQSGAGA
jgi:hypothetical protein